MADKKTTVLDVLARLESLERKNKALEQELNQLKSELAPEKWHELILYRQLHKQTLTEITWTEDDDEEKQRYYREDEPMRREVTGLVRKVAKDQNE
ncbi:MAG: hypothetical protein H8E18_14075 [FCB group bacterium]|nr:hypothetical protein [FCB group bacterium]